jgi:hypothetical protein
MFQSALSVGLWDVDYELIRILFSDFSTLSIKLPSNHFKEDFKWDCVGENSVFCARKDSFKLKETVCSSSELFNSIISPWI